MLASGFALLISLTINGQSDWEAIPNVYKTQEDCVKAAKQYEGIVDRSVCFYSDKLVLKEEK